MGFVSFRRTDLNKKCDALLENCVNSVRAEVDAEIASIKLDAMNIKINNLITEQVKYLNSWEEGT